MTNNVICIAGTSNAPLAQSIIYHLGCTKANTAVERFSDDEISVEIHDSVRESTAVLIQSTSRPANDTLMELMLTVDALARASAQKIIAVIPYFGYARQDRRPGYRRMPITARLTADMLEAAGVHHVITVDLHATQIQGFFKIPVDNISAVQLFAADIELKYGRDSIVVVSPDTGGVARARLLAKALGDVDLAIVDKRRPRANVSEVMNVIGDVSGKVCIMVDDMIDTAGTICHAATALKERGAKAVVAYATHGVLSGRAYDNITGTAAIDEIVVTDSIQLFGYLDRSAKIRQISIAKLLADTINRVTSGASVSAVMD